MSRIRILCVGRVKDGPEREMVTDYMDRARRLGPGLGWREIQEIEVASGEGKDREGQRLIDKCDAEIVVRLDERGKPWTSVDLSKQLSNWRDNSQGVDFIIGGADGLSRDVAKRATHSFALGPQTWPHRLVRVMLAEQVYRALSIEAGTPYHRA